MDRRYINSGKGTSVAWESPCISVGDTQILAVSQKVTTGGGKQLSQTGTAAGTVSLHLP